LSKTLLGIPPTSPNTMMQYHRWVRSINPLHAVLAFYYHVRANDIWTDSGIGTYSGKRKRQEIWCYCVLESEDALSNGVIDQKVENEGLDGEVLTQKSRSKSSH
jgi:hypothetical protein